MINRDKQKNINLYLRKIEIEMELAKINKSLEPFNLELFVSACEKELEQLENDVILSYFKDRKSLKKIAFEMNYSYPYVRKIFINGKEKMRIILSLCKKN